MVGQPTIPSQEKEPRGRPHFNHHNKTTKLSAVFATKLGRYLVTKHHITKHLKEDEVATEENEVPDCPATDSTDEEVTKGLDCRKHEEKPSPWVQTAGAEGQPQRRRRRY